jgi:hypothetical protein
MPFDTALNALWVLVGGVALLWILRARYRSAPERSVGTTPLHVVRLALVVAALFPYVSATDDVVRIQTLDQQHEHSHPAGQNQNQNLIRLYETMDTPLVCRVQEITFVLFFVALVITPVLKCISRSEPAESGRPPPLAMGSLAMQNGC